MLGIVYIFVGCVLIASGTGAIVYREHLVRASVKAQRRFFGDWIRHFQGSETPTNMLMGGILMVVGGLWGVFLGIKRL